MPVIEGDLVTSTESAEECLELATFSCGDKRYAYEETVERIVGHFREGRIAGATLRVTREMPSAALVGLSIIELRAGPRIRHRLLPEDEFRDAAYAHVMALSGVYRGGYTTPDGAAVSDFIVAEMLGHIRDSEGAMPVIQAFIESDNELSQEMCFRNGFEQPFVTEPDLLYVRYPDIEVP
jgi:hypothetical protein